MRYMVSSTLLTTEYQIASVVLSLSGCFLDEKFAGGWGGN